MSGYGPPPPAPPARSAGTGLGLPTLLAYGAGALGILDFIWGFLDWVGGDGSDGVSGYFYGGGAAVGLALAAGLWAAARTLDKSDTSLLGPAALSVAALLVVFGNLVGQPDGADTKVGMILALITTLVQVAVLVYSWLLAIGKVSAPAPKPPAPAQGYGPPQGGPQGYGPPQGGPQGYGPPQGGPSGPPPGYGAPQGPPSGPPQGGFGAPSSYGQPQGGQQGGPSGPPPGYGSPQGPPSSPPPPQGNPYSPPPGN